MKNFKDKETNIEREREKVRKYFLLQHHSYIALR